MKRLLILALLSLTLLSCQPGEAVESTQKGDFKIEFLFEQDGCRVYRFKDGTRYVYYSDCRGKTEESHTERVSRQTHTKYIETINVGR